MLQARLQHPASLLVVSLWIWGLELSRYGPTLTRKGGPTRSHMATVSPQSSLYLASRN